MQPAIKMALRIARQGSDYLKAHFERQELNARDPEDLGVQLDRVQQSIYTNFSEQLEKSYRDHVIAPLGEVDGGDAPKSWHIFPLIGREAFLRGLPEFALAMVEKQGNRAEHVLMINPVTGEEYSASRGNGAALNSRRIRTRDIRHASDASVVTNLLDQARGAEDPLLWGEMAATLAQKTQRVHSSGCAALDLARVAAGHHESAVLFRPEPLDRMIGQLMASESGALSADFSGNPAGGEGRQLVVANPRLFKELLQILAPFRGRLPR